MNRGRARDLARLATRSVDPLFARNRAGVLMIHLGRSGSTVVGDLLRQNRRIRWSGEIYSRIFRGWQEEAGGREVVGEMPSDAIDHLRRDMSLALHRRYGFEMKPFHFELIGHSPSAFVDELAELGFDRFVLLNRENRLRKIVSSVLAHEDRQRLHVPSSEKVPIKRVRLEIESIAIDFKDQPLLQHLRGYDRSWSELSDILPAGSVLELSYEEHVQRDPRVAYSKICDFLDLESGEVEVKLGRTNPFRLEEIITNLDEVRHELAETEFAWMLEEP